MKLIVFIFLLCRSVTLHAQQFNVTLTPETEEGNPLLLKFGDGLFAADIEMKGMSGFSANLKRMIHSIELKKYSSDLKLVKSVKLSNGERLYGPMAPLLKIINGKLYLLYYKMPEDGNVQFFSAEVDPVSLNQSAPAQLLTIKQKVSYLEYHMRSVNDYHNNRVVYKYSGLSQYKTFFFEPSPDGSKFLTLWNSGWDNRLFFSVLDKNMNTIRTGEEEVLKESSLTLSNACIDNSGNVYISYFYYKKSKGHAEVLISTKTGKSIKEIIIPDGEPYGVFAGINNKTNKVYICGSYKEKGSRLNGVFIQSLNPADLQMTAVSKTVFPKELVSLFEKDDWGKADGKDYGLSNDIVFDSYMLENGTMNLTGEFRSVTEGQRASFKFSGSILNARFSESGAVFSRIPKVRVSAGTTFGDSYKLFEYKNKLIVFYNDHASNVKLDLSKAPTRSDNYSNSVLVAATIDVDGSIKREIIVDQSKQNYLASNETMQQLSPASYFVAFRGIKSLGGITKDIKWAIIEIK